MCIRDRLSVLFVAERDDRGFAPTRVGTEFRVDVSLDNLGDGLGLYRIMWGEKKRGNSRQSQKYKNFEVLEKKRRKSKKDSKDDRLLPKALLSRIDRVVCFPDDRSRPEGVRSSAQRTIARDDDDVRVFVLRELDRWTLDPSKRHAIHIARDAIFFRISKK